MTLEELNAIGVGRLPGLVGLEVLEVAPGRPPVRCTQLVLYPPAAG